MPLFALSHFRTSSRPSLVAKCFSAALAFLLCSLGSARAADKRPQQTDAQLRHAVIGTWEYHPTKGKEIIGGFIRYNADGTFHSIGILRLHNKKRSASADGKWEIKDGIIGRTMTQCSFRPAVGTIERDRILSATRDLLVTTSGSGIEKDHRAHFPSHLPPLYTVEYLSASQCRQLGLPLPRYPDEAAREQLQGSGAFRVNIAKNGDISSVEILRSTGSNVLDDAARDTFLRWHFKSTTDDAVIIQMDFQLPGHTATAPTFVRREPATLAPVRSVAPGNR